MSKATDELRPDQGTPADPGEEAAGGQVERDLAALQAAYGPPQPRDARPGQLGLELDAVEGGEEAKEGDDG
jgi:hypothetical protein